MNFKQSLIIFGCFISLMLVVQAQETTIRPEVTSIDKQDDATTTIQPVSPNRFMRFLHDPMRRGFSSARRFMRNRLDDVRHGINMTRIQTYKMFMSFYNKTYLPQEIPRRMALFFKRREEIRQSIKDFIEGKSSYAMRENEFTDWDETELKKLTGVSVPSNEQLESDDREFSGTVSMAVGSTMMDVNNEDPNITVKADKIPASKDWRTSGCVYTPIDQKSCGACYAIATMSVVETMKCLKNSWAPRLSSQQIVDCARSSAGYKNYGCNGGWPTRVLEYLQDVGIAARDWCYPFVRKQETCKLTEVKDEWACSVNASTIPDKKLEFKVLHNEEDILYHVANTGPVVTAMEATRNFVYYGEGIFEDWRCLDRKRDVDHAIVIVGYGSENGKDYWIIKNSWGKDWGMDGYAKYRRNKHTCSIGYHGWVVTS